MNIERERILNFKEIFLKKYTSLYNSSIGTPTQNSSAQIIQSPINLDTLRTNHSLGSI